MSTAVDPATTTSTDSSTPEADATRLQDSLKRIQHTFKELTDYSRYYAELHWDQLKFSLVQYVLLAVLGIAAMALLVTLLIAGGIVMVIGFSYSLGLWLFGGNVAYGLLLGGTLIVVTLLAMVGIGILVVRSRFRAGLDKKYETKKQEQRARYGHDVEQRAAIA